MLKQKRDYPKKGHDIWQLPQLIFSRIFIVTRPERDLLFVAAEVEDTIISEMTDQHKEICGKIDALDKKVEDSSLLSIDRNLTLANDGRLDVVGKEPFRILFRS